LPDSIQVTVEPPRWPPPPELYVIDYKTRHLSIPSGQSADAEIVYTNTQKWPVRIPLFGPCWHVVSETGPSAGMPGQMQPSVSCNGPSSTLTIGSQESAALHGTVWAREGFVQSGAPLAPGRHMMNMGDTMSETLAVTPDQATWIDVT